MIQPTDVWFVRLPDGQVLRAKSTAALRHHLESGQVPLDSRVRRSPLEAWATLAKVEEFADLVALSPEHRHGAARAAKEPSADNRSAGMQLETVGVRGVVTELLAALDSTLVRSKLEVAATTGLAAGLVLLLGVVVPSLVAVPWPWLPWLVQGLALLLITAGGGALLSQLTVLELSRLQPVTWSEARTGLGKSSARLTFANLLVIGGAVLAIVVLRWLPSWLLEQTEPEWLADSRDVLASVAVVVHLLVEVVLWPMLGCTLLLVPILTVEECSVAQALAQWRSLLREHPGKILLYEVLAAALAVAAALPFVLPVELAALSLPGTGLAGVVGQAALGLLRGLALTPLFACLVVANVFLYLNLRYEHTQGG